MRSFFTKRTDPVETAAYVLAGMFLPEVREFIKDTRPKTFFCESGLLTRTNFIREGLPKGGHSSTHTRGCTITWHGTVQSDIGEVGVGAWGWYQGSGGVVYGRWCPKRVRGTGQAGQTSLAGWARQGRSRGSICVYRTTRVWDRRCSDTSAIIALRLAPIRPSRQHYAHLLVRFTPPPLTRRRPPYLLRLPTARAASGRARCNGPPAWEQEPRGGAEPR